VSSGGGGRILDRDGPEGAGWGYSWLKELKGGRLLLPAGGVVLFFVAVPGRELLLGVIDAVDTVEALLL